MEDIFIQKLKVLKVSKKYLDLYRSIVSDIYQKENRFIFSEKRKAIHSIEQLANRISKAKNLMLDGHIEFSSFQEMKTDFETKISILGDTVSSYSKKQLEFTDKVNNSGLFLSQMDAFYCQLPDAYKRSFLNRILIRSAHWNSDNLDQIFRREFQNIYKSSNNINEVELLRVKELLSDLAKMEISLKNPVL